MIKISMEMEREHTMAMKQNSSLIFQEKRELIEPHYLVAEGAIKGAFGVCIFTIDSLRNGEIGEP